MKIKILLATVVAAVIMFSGCNSKPQEQVASQKQMEKKGMMKKKMFQSVADSEATILQDDEAKMYCINCGMYLPKFYKTNHAVKFKDGKFRQFCSMYCLVEQLELTDLRGKEDTIEDFIVVDVKSLKFIRAKEAYYVVGSKVPGTMTVTSKYAFKNKSDAVEFQSMHGGKLATYEEAYQSALKDFARDTGLVLAKRDSKMYKMGKKLYDTQCNKKKLSKIDAHTMADMKLHIQKTNVCGENLNDGQLQAIMLYYWDVRLNKFNEMYGQNEEVMQHAEKFKKKFQQMEKNKQ